jgi:hypothetical protein
VDLILIVRVARNKININQAVEILSYYKSETTRQIFCPSCICQIVAPRDAHDSLLAITLWQPKIISGTCQNQNTL